MTEQEIAKMLDQLAEFKLAEAELAAAKEAKIAEVYTPEIHQAIEDVQAEFTTLEQAASKNIADVTDQIKKAVIEHAASVKGATLQAVYNKGRVSFDTKAAAAYLEAMGVYEKYCKEGDPFVTIR